MNGPWMALRGLGAGATWVLVAAALGGCSLLFDGSDLTGGMDAGAQREDAGDAARPDAGRDAGSDADRPPPDSGPLCADVDCSSLDDACVRGVCDGVTGSCVAEPRPAGTACGDSSTSACDAADTCDGAGACVPNYASEGTACGDSSATECNLPDTCDGAGVCLTNHASEGTACGDPTVNACTAADTCDGAGVCLPNHQPAETLCGDMSTTECSDPDTCDGAGTCVPNHAMVGTACGDPSTSDCDAADSCDGAGGCLRNLALFAAPCGDRTTTECSLPDSCDGLGFCLPNHRSTGTSCGDGSNTECSAPDSCNGAGVCLPNHRLAGTTCGDTSSTPCSQPDSCDGGGACLPNHRPSGFSCGDSLIRECSAPDTCYGGGECEPNHRPEGTSCGDTSMTECSLPDSCDAAGTCLPNHRPAGTACGSGATSDCDSADSCSGTGTCRPNNRPDGTACTSCSMGPECLTCASGICPDLPLCTVRFTNVTAAAGLPSATGGAAVIWLDIEPDGDLDLFIRGRGLFVNDGAGSFTEESEARGITDLGGSSTSPVSIGDYDNDGRIDLFVGRDASFGPLRNRMYRNTGGGMFSNVAAAFGIELSSNDPTAGVFVDHDRDNDLDLLYVTVFGDAQMYRNDGALPFGDDSGLFDADLQGDSAAWADYDGDGIQDLFVPTGFSGIGNLLFRGNGGTWVEGAAAAGVEDDPTSSARWGGVTWVDIDADGDLDLHVVRDGGGNDLLYLNRADGTFAETLASTLGLGDSRFGRSAMWADYDRDGDLDAYIGEAGLFRNDGGTFTNVTAAAGISVVGSVGAWGDFDGDGRLDLLVSSAAGTRLWRSSDASTPCRDPNGAVFVRVTTDQDGDTTDAYIAEDRDAIGARVDVDLDGDGDFVAGGYAGSDRIVTYLVGSAQSGNLAQSQLGLAIGIGAAPRVDIRVTFVDGTVVIRRDVVAGTTLTIGDL